MEVVFLKGLQLIKQSEILLVDDTPEHIEAAVSLLRENNFKVRIATKGSTALKLIKKRQPDLILLDVYMPEMDGFEVCKIIKSSSDFSSIPIIFLTSSNDEESIKKARFWATQARDPAPWYQHSEIGYNYRMSNIVAGIGRGQDRKSVV